jgi:putative DNA primase/helicase
MLDRLVAAARGDGGGGRQGRALSLPDAVPWPEPLDGAALLDRLSGFFAFARHVFLPSRAPDAMAAWTVHSHGAALSRHSPRLAFTSPQKRCGKTTALDAVGLVVAKPLPTANVTAGAIFRTIEAARPTLLIDEADTLPARQRGNARHPECRSQARRAGYPLRWR